MLDAVQVEAAEPVLVDGLWIDPDTGEVLSLERKPDFQVVDDESADWVLQRLMNAEADLKSIEAKEAAVLENFRAMKAAAQRRIDGIRYRFGSDLEHWAMTELEGRKEKSLRLAYGTLGFRRQKGGLRLADAAEAKKFALNWAKHLGYSEAVAVKEEFQISGLTAQQREKLEKLVDMGLSDVDLGGVRMAFQVKPDVDVFSVKTGLAS